MKLIRLKSLFQHHPPRFLHYFFRHFRIVMIPLFAGILVLVFALHYFENAAKSTFITNTNEISSRIDNTISDISQTSSLLLTDASLVSLSRMSDIPLYSHEHTHKLQLLQNKISTMQSTNGSITSIQILFHESQFYMTQEVCYQITSPASDIYLSRQMGSDVYQAFMNDQSGSRLFFPFSVDGTNQSSFYYLRTATTSTDDLVSILFEIDKSAFRGQMMSENLSCFLYNDDTFIYSDHHPDVLPETLAQLELNTYDTPFTWTRHYHGILSASATPGLYTLLTIIPTTVYNIHTYYIILIGIIYIILCLTVGFLISYFMAKKSATPIANMLASLGAASFAGDYQNELKLIEESLLELQRNNRQYRVNMNHYQAYVANDCLIRLLKQRSYSNPIDLQQYQTFLKDISSNHYLLLGFDIEDASDLFFDSGDSITDTAGQMQDMIFFILQNVGAELLQEHFHCCFGDVDGHLVCLLGTDQNQADVNLALQNCLSSLVYFLKNKFNVSIAICVSDMVNDISQIPETYVQILNVMHYRNLVGSNSYVLYHKDISKETPEQDIILPIMQALYQQDYQNALKQLEEICPSHHNKKTPSAKANISQDVWEYIQNNYTDHNLSAGQIAEHFHIGLSNLSQLYKRDTGHGILDDIHYCRVQKAKQLLSERYSIQNTAQLSGYYNTRPMVEAFKRIEGMTPSEYKNKVNSDHD